MWLLSVFAITNNAATGILETCPRAQHACAALWYQGHRLQDMRCPEPAHPETQQIRACSGQGRGVGSDGRGVWLLPELENMFSAGRGYHTRDCVGGCVVCP